MLCEENKTSNKESGEIHQHQRHMESREQHAEETSHTIGSNKDNIKKQQHKHVEQATRKEIH